MAADDRELLRRIVDILDNPQGKRGAFIVYSGLGRAWQEESPLSSALLFGWLFLLALTALTTVSAVFIGWPKAGATVGTLADFFGGAAGIAIVGNGILEVVFTVLASLYRKRQHEKGREEGRTVTTAEWMRWKQEYDVWLGRKAQAEHDRLPFTEPEPATPAV